MKRLVPIFLLFLCLSSNCLLAESWDSLFVAANEAYKKKDFPHCIMLLDSIHRQGYGSENTYFNEGNAYYKLQNYPYAILNYERASRLAPYNKEIAQNLRLANKQLTERISAVPTFFLVKWGQNIRDLLPANVWQFVCLLALLAAIILMYFYRKKNQKRLFPISIALFAFSFISLITGFQKYQAETRKDEAIIMANEIMLKKAPGMGTETVLTVFGGVKILILREMGEWAMVQLPNGEQGWLEKKNFEVI